MASMNVEARLRGSLKTGRAVRIRRNIRETDVLDGYVMAIGAKWVLLTVLKDVSLDGFTAVRLKDIKKVGRGHAPKFWRRALELQGEWPPARPSMEVSLDGIRKLFASTGDALVAFHIEREDPHVCFVGVPLKTSRKWLTVEEVSAKAKWRAGPSQFSLKSITRVDFEGGYLAALTAVAGPSHLFKTDDATDFRRGRE